MGKRGPRPTATPEELRERKRLRSHRRWFESRGQPVPDTIRPKSEHGTGTRKTHRQRKGKDRARPKRAVRNHAFILAYKLAHPCVDCGYSDPRALTFDHRDRRDKTADISKLVTGGRPIARIQAEIDVCDVVCANCHMIRTKEGKHWQPIVW
jgi:hypothetical protein